MPNLTPEQLLTQAESLCLDRGVRLTTQRAEVLRLMAEQNGSISAYDLLDQLRISEPRRNHRLFIARWISAGAGVYSSGGVK